jgi:hypothetical protein
MMVAFHCKHLLLFSAIQLFNLVFLILWRFIMILIVLVEIMLSNMIIFFQSASAVFGRKLVHSFCIL